MKRILASLALVSTLGATHAAYAQYYQPRPRPVYAMPNPTMMTRGYIGFSGLGTGILNQSGGVELLDNGGGISIWGGIRFGPMFALEADYLASFHNPAPDLCDVYGYCSASYMVFETFGVDAKIHFPTGSNFDPFVQGGAGFGWLGREGFGTDSKGGGLDLGGGFDLWLNYWWTFGIRGLYRGYSMKDVGADSRTFLSIATLEINLAAHF